MDISVIILAYNAVDTIEKAIESVLCQDTSAEFEIILANDCSTDDTDRICKKYSSLYPDKIRYINRKRNIGLVANYFDCFNKATGKYITDCSCDDYWTDIWKLQELYQALEMNKEITLVSSQWVCRNVNNGTTYIASNAIEPGYYKGNELLMDLLMNKKVVNLSSSMYRKSIIEKKMMSSPEIFMGKDAAFEDLSLVMCCASEGNIFVSSDITTCYNINPRSVSNTDDPAKRYEFFFKSLIQKSELKNYFIKDLTRGQRRRLADYFRKEADHIMSIRFSCGPEKGKNLSIGWSGSFSLGIKGHIYKLLMKWKQLWRIGNKIKHSFLKRKAL